MHLKKPFKNGLRKRKKNTDMEHKSTFMILLIFTILVGWTGASAVAEMVIIDFENLSDGQNIHNMNLGGVTLSIPGTHGQRGPYVDTPRYDPGNVFFDYQYSRILRTPDGSDDIVGVFDIPVTTVSIEVGRYHDYDKFPPPGGGFGFMGLAMGIRRKRRQGRHLLIESSSVLL